MPDSFVVLTAYGAINAVHKVSEAVKDGNISPEEANDILEGARLQNGSLDPNAIALVEEMAKQMQALAAKMKETQKEEAIPVVELAAFSIPEEDLDETVFRAVGEAMFASMPLSMSTTTTIRGAREHNGAHDILVAVHSFMTGPTNESDHYLVSIARDGTATKPTRVTVE